MFLLMKYRWIASIKRYWTISYIVFILVHGLCSVSMAEASSTAAGSDLSRDTISAEIVIEVRESAHVNSRKVTLGDIADIIAPELLKSQLASIDAGFAPLPGKTTIVDGRRIESKIKSNRLFSDDMALIVPEKVYLERESQEVSADDLHALYEEYVSEHSDGREFEIRDFAVRGLEIYPEGELLLSAPLSNSRELKGRVTLYVNVQVNGKEYGRLSLSGWIDIFDDVVCASRSLTRGKLLEPGDLNIQRVNVSNIHGDYFRSDQDLLGKVLTRNTSSNKVLMPNMVEDAALLHKGDTVKIIASRGNLSITTLGIVKSDGKIDDTVQVQNMTSGKIINGIVLGKESVKVFY